MAKNLQVNVPEAGIHREIQHVPKAGIHREIQQAISYPLTDVYITITSCQADITCHLVVYH